MSVVPAGPISVAVDGLKTLIANVPWFQTWTNSASADAALGSIFTGEDGFPVASAAITSGVLTVNTREPHDMLVGDVVTIEGASTGEQSILNIDGAQTILSVTATSFTAATDAPDQALAYPDFAIVLPGVRPLAFVSEFNDGVRATSIGTGGTAVYAGSIEITIEANVSMEYANDRLNALYEARNAWGSFIEGLAETQDTGDLMVLNTVEPVSGPAFISVGEQSDNTVRFEAWRAMVKVTWGLDA